MARKKPKARFTQPIEGLNGVEMNLLRIGDKAPEFKVKGFLRGRVSEYSLGASKGKWLVLFFLSGRLYLYLSDGSYRFQQGRQRICRRGWLGLGRKR